MSLYAMDDKLNEFVVWLRENGAKYDKIDWPVTNERVSCQSLYSL